MPHKFDLQRKGALRIPFLLEWENAQQQIEVARHLPDAAFARGPDLRRDILNEFRLPVIEGASPGAHVILYRVAEAAIEAGEIDADDDVRFPLDRESDEPIEECFEFTIILQHLDQAHDRVSRHVKSQFDSGFSHPWTARSKE